KLYRVDKNGKDKELIAVDSFVVKISNLVASRYDDFSIKNPNPQKNGMYEAEGLPEGLSIDPANGTISGKPTKAGEYSVKVSTTIQEESGDIKGSRNYEALITDSPLENGEVGKAYNQEVKPQAIEGYVFKNVTSKFIDGKAIDGLTIENNQITGTPTKEVSATQTTDDGAMGPNVEVTYDIYKLNSKGEEVLVKKDHKDLVPLVIKEKTEQEADKYTPTADPVEKDKGTAVTEKDVTDAVKVPDFKENPKFPGQTPKVTVDDPSKLPDGNTVGTTDVAVTVTYPDGSTDKLTVPVTIKDTTPAPTEADKYEPTVEKEEVEKGGKVDLTDNVTNLDKLPEGTT
ncbi:MAG: Rib/alpha-like domain-containing protein, partial [Finegoldia magna]|nr:Rib/alpha-like domain-containing protein [Finegoldia magna]